MVQSSSPGKVAVDLEDAIDELLKIQPGALILFNKALVVQVQGVLRYASFAQMLVTEGLDKVLPGVETMDAGVQVYRRFYTEEEESSYVVIGIHVSRTAIQPHIYLAKILSELHSSGKLESLVDGFEPLKARENQ